MINKFIKNLIDSFGYERKSQLVEAVSPFVAKDRDHLIKLIKDEIGLNGNSCDLNHIDISRVTDFNKLFSDHNIDFDPFDSTQCVDFSRFDGDISKWDVSHVTNMKEMFFHGKFSGDLSQWDVSNADNIDRMFEGSPAPKPYWANYTNKDERNKAINAYCLHEELSQKLSGGVENEDIKKRAKI